MYFAGIFQSGGSPETGSLLEEGNVIQRSIRVDKVEHKDLGNQVVFKLGLGSVVLCRYTREAEKKKNEVSREDRYWIDGIATSIELTPFGQFDSDGLPKDVQEDNGHGIDDTTHERTKDGQMLVLYEETEGENADGYNHYDHNHTENERKGRDNLGGTHERWVVFARSGHFCLVSEGEREER